MALGWRDETIWVVSRSSASNRRGGEISRLKAY